MTTVLDTSAPPAPRWRSVALPREHGGWGLTLEPVLLGLLVAWSVAGTLIAVAAFGAFLIRTPLKVAAVDIRRDQWRPRSTLALKVAGLELLIVLGATAGAIAGAGWSWLIPAAFAAPLVGVSFWYDVRSRSRRLTPELCGAVGMAAVTASIVLAGGGDATLGVALAMILAGRSVGAIVFVRVQIARLRRPGSSVGRSDLAQFVAAAVGAAAVAVDIHALAGAAAIVGFGCIHAVQSRRPLRPIKAVGVQQMVFGLVLVAVTATGALVA